jgi:two-component system phosphate regulon sensor histidine kinase PhoR
MRTVKTASLSVTHIILLLLALILLPILLYSGYELSTLSESEDMVANVYRQQLDVVLFSINQYAWDLAGTWITRLSSPSRPGSDLEALELLRRTPVLQAIFRADTAFRSVRVVTRPGDKRARALEMSLTAAGRSDPERLRRLIRYSGVEYRKLEPLPIGSGDSAHVIALMFLPPADGDARFEGFVVDETRLVVGVLAPRLRDAAGGDFVLGIFREGSETALVSTGPLARPEIATAKDLWLLPGLTVGIRMKGQTVDEVVRARFVRNLALLLLLDALLLAGAWLVFRTLRRQVELVRMKSDFVSNVSHELRTPLSLIRMYAETLEMGRLADPVKRQEYTSTIVREAERLTRLVNNILNFSRMEAGRKEFHFDAVDLNGLVRDVLETYRLPLEAESCTPVLALDPALPRIRGDREALAEALVNLVDNALKYSPEVKYLRIATAAAANGVTVAVEDHGVGIPAGEQEKIFELFYRVSTGLVQTTRGTGLGLALVRRIADAHGGTITVTSTPGSGSTFHLSFPRMHQGTAAHGTHTHH